MEHISWGEQCIRQEFNEGDRSGVSHSLADVNIISRPRFQLTFDELFPNSILPLSEHVVRIVLELTVSFTLQKHLRAETNIDERDLFLKTAPRLDGHI